MSDAAARLSTPRSSRPSTPRPGTPSGPRTVVNMADDFVKNPPNNLNLRDPSEQSRANDLIGVEGTVPAGVEAQSKEEIARIREMAEKLERKRGGKGE